MVNFEQIDAIEQMHLEYSPFHQWVFPNGAVWTEFFRTDTGYLLRFPDLADFEISTDGRAVFCRPVPDVSKETCRHLYLNQVLPLALSKRGKLVFHGSAVEVDGGVVAFIAESGRGKSTMAAGFAGSGFRFLTDDGLVVEACDNGHQVLPGHPSIRLWADSEEALIEPGAEAAPPLPFTSKSRFLADSEIAFCDQTRPLRKVYFLGDGSATSLTIQPMSGIEALVEWVKHSFLLDIEEQALLATHFDHVTNLANQPIHYRLDYPRRFAELPDVRQAILEHLKKEDGVVE